MSALVDGLGGNAVQSSKMADADVMGNPNALAAALAAQANKLKPANSEETKPAVSDADVMGNPDALAAALAAQANKLKPANAEPKPEPAMSDADVMGNPDALAAALAAQANKLKPAGGANATPLPPKRPEDMSFAE